MSNNDSAQSCSKQSDEPTCERPFKKAKYAWQVKGKSHLKTETPTSSLQQTDYHLAEQERKEKEQYLSELRQIKDEPYTRRCSGRHASCYGCDYIHHILRNSEQLMEEDESDIESDDEIDVGSKHKWCRLHGPSMVPKAHRKYDHYLAKWQSRQLAKSYVDNTINAALERWMISPPYVDATDLVENSENDVFVEDEGILMAIQSHGLRSQMFLSQTCPHHINHRACHQSLIRTDARYTVVDQEADSSVPGYITSKEDPGYSILEPDHVRHKVVNQVADSSEESELLSREEPEDSIVEEQVDFEDWDFLSAAVGVAIQEKGLKNI